MRPQTYPLLKLVYQELHHIYDLPVPIQAENLDDFVIQTPSKNENCLLIEERDGDLFLGLQFNASVLDYLGQKKERLTPQLIHDPSFFIVAEEASHLLYSILHLSAHSTISMLELEVQAEIDRFLILKQAHTTDPQPLHEIHKKLLEVLFQNFNLQTHTKPEDSSRYREAHRLGKKACEHIAHITETNPPEAHRIVKTLHALPGHSKLHYIESNLRLAS